MSIENILDATLDDLSDAPSTKLFPNGAHKVALTFVTDLKKQSVYMTMTYVDKIELAEPTAVAPEVGDKNVVFMNLVKKDGTKNEYSQGALKEIMKVLQPVFQGTNIADTLTKAAGVEVIVATKVRMGKGEYEGRDQIDIVEMSIV